MYIRFPIKVKVIGDIIKFLRDRPADFMNMPVQMYNRKFLIAALSCSSLSVFVQRLSYNEGRLLPSLGLFNAQATCLHLQRDPALNYVVGAYYNYHFFFLFFFPFSSVLVRLQTISKLLY